MKIEYDPHTRTGLAWKAAILYYQLTPSQAAKAYKLGLNPSKFEIVDQGARSGAHRPVGEWIETIYLKRYEADMPGALDLETLLECIDARVDRGNRSKEKLYD